MSPTGLSVREARRDDIAEISRMHRRSILVLGRSHYSKAELESWARGLDRRFYEDALEHTALFEVAVARATGAVVAIGATREDEVWLLYTDPDWAGRGAGTALLERTEADIARRGHGTARVRSSLNAEAFYAARGYRALARLRHETRGGLRLAAVTMEKTLALGTRG